MNSLQIRYFLTVADHLSFSRAAEKLFTSQPSVTRQIAALEREFGVKLFLRNKHSVELTEAGQLLYHELSAMTLRLEDTLEKARQLAGGTYGKLRIGYLQEMNIDIILPYIKQFFVSYPDVALSLEGYGFRELRDRIVNGALDVAFMLSFELADMPFLMHCPVFLTRAHLVLSAEHSLVKEHRLAPDTLLQESVVVTDETEKGTAFVLSQLENYGARPRDIIHSATSESIIMYVESKRAIAVMDAGNRFYGDERFYFHPLPGEKAIVSVDAAWRKDNANSAIALFEKMLQRMPDAPLQ